MMVKLWNITFVKSFEKLRRKPTKLYDGKITEHYACKKFQKIMSQTYEIVQ